MSSTPSIVLVHGFWGGAAHWSKVISELSKSGYSAKDIHAVENPLTSLSDDAERTRKELVGDQDRKQDLYSADDRLESLRRCKP